LKEYASFRVGGAPTLFEKIIEFPSGRVLIAFCRFFRGTIFEFKVIAEVGPILIKAPLGLRLTALIVILRVVVAAVEAAAKIRPTYGTDVFPSHCFGNINFSFAFVA
jgi:hypothetical protein